MPLATVAVVAVGLAVAGAWWLNTKRESGPLAAGADFIAVMPLGSTGDSTLARLGRDLVVTVSATLDGVGEVRTVDAMSVLAGTSNEANPIGLETAREIGRRLGAASVVHGSLVPEGDLVRADVGLYPTAGGDAIARLSVRAAASVAGGLTDSLASGLLRQIWRRGTPPSSLLSDVTTASTEALRLFLEGERYFETFDTELAVATYKRATAIDSNFAQAWLRISQVRGSAPGGSDTVANRRVSELADRLPVRERELLQLQDTPMPIPERFAAYTAFAQRYPEHYMAQYRAGDIPIHTGPRYGIPVEAARPYIDRLDVLAPKHYDNAQHRYFLAFVVGDTAQIIKATRDMAARGTGEFTGWAQALAGLSDRYEATGERATSEQLVAFLGTLTPIMRMSRSLTQWSLLVPAPFTTTAMWSEAVATIRRDPTLREFHEPAGVAEAVIRFGRGEVNGGVEDLLAINRPGLRPALLTSGVRNASYAVWFGFAEPSLLDKAIAQTRPFTQNLPLDQRYEVEWGEGIAAIVTKDSLRFMRALQTVSDTAEQVERVINRSLRALWRERHTGAADSLRALEDGLIREGGVFLSALPIHRAAIGRTLMREGDAEHAAFYLRWSDGLSFEERMILIEAATEGLLSFERGRVAEALGDSRAAALHYSRFLMNVDRPPAAVAAQMADARTRLDALIAARK